MLVLADFAESGAFIPVIAIVSGTLMVIVITVVSAMVGVAKTKAREETKRELAAYVAEGTIDADKAIAMLHAGSTTVDISGLDDALAGKNGNVVGMKVCCGT